MTLTTRQSLFPLPVVMFEHAAFNFYRVSHDLHSWGFVQIIVALVSIVVIVVLVVIIVVVVIVAIIVIVVVIVIVVIVVIVVVIIVFYCCYCLNIADSMLLAWSLSSSSLLL